MGVGGGGGGCSEAGLSFLVILGVEKANYKCVPHAHWVLGNKSAFWTITNSTHKKIYNFTKS